MNCISTGGNNDLQRKGVTLQGMRPMWLSHILNQRSRPQIKGQDWSLRKSQDQEERTIGNLKYAGRDGQAEIGNS